MDLIPLQAPGRPKPIDILDGIQIFHLGYIFWHRLGLYLVYLVAKIRLGCGPGFAHLPLLL